MLKSDLAVALAVRSDQVVVVGFRAGSLIVDVVVQGLSPTAASAMERGLIAALASAFDPNIFGPCFLIPPMNGELTPSKFL